MDLKRNLNDNFSGSINTEWISEALSKHCQTSKTELFAKTAGDWKPLFSQKNSVFQGYEYASEYV